MVFTTQEDMLLISGKFTITFSMKNALSIDLEEYFQIHVLSGIINPDSWASFPSCVEQNSLRILRLLEEHGVKATFFCLGWIAEHHKNLIRLIHEKGHEVACHGYSHQAIYRQDIGRFRDDVSRAKTILEDITGEPVIGYRAPTYSITVKTLWALDILENLGFRYDSSIFPIYHDNYGIPDAPRFPYHIPNSSLVEFPISTLKIGPLNLPISGGGYFRLIPYKLISGGFRHLNARDKPFIFYIHPWEMNPEIPKIKGMNTFSRFRTYTGIQSAFNKFSHLLKDFTFAPVHEVLSDLGLLSAQQYPGRQA
jgi:polysaccharide deacetylase family protein (PEP-CTERM system associated)